MIAAGTAAKPMDARHTIDSEAPTTVATTMPTPMAIWNASTSRPRYFGGASSATYIGAVCVAPPTAKPSTIRPRESTNGFGENAHQSEPMANTTANISSVPLRPRRSDSQLQVSAPITAPSRMLAAMTCFQPSAMPKSFVICSRAPEMMPVS
jgi:hypothetical protein